MKLEELSPQQRRAVEAEGRIREIDNYIKTHDVKDGSLSAYRQIQLNLESEVLKCEDAMWTCGSFGGYSLCPDTINSSVNILNSEKTVNLNSLG